MDVAIVYGSWELMICGLKSFSGISEAGDGFEAGMEQEGSQWTKYSCFHWAGKGS